MDKMRDLTVQLRRNQQDVGDFLTDLDSWTKDIKKQDENLKTMKPQKKADSAYPPVRSKAIVEKVKKKREDNAKSVKKDRIKSSDYRTWEKLDVDAMLKEVDDEEREMDEEVQVEVEKLDAKRKQRVATEMKEKGNEHFKNKGYEAAIECYTTGMQADPNNPVFPANRAMAFLKLKKYAQTEADCTLALSLDPSYTKAYLRRGTARVALGKSSSAGKDFTDALKLEPSNPQAKAEIKKLDEAETSGKVKENLIKPNPINDSTKKSKYVYPIFIPPKKRSKKPLMRVEVQEIGGEDTEKVNTRISKTELDSILGRDALTITPVTNGKMEETPPKSLISVMADGDASKSVKPDKIKEKNLIEEVVSFSQNQEAQMHNMNGVTHSISSNEDTSAPKLSKSDSSTSQDSNLSTTKSSIPPCPVTSFQFQAHVKKLSNDCELLFKYMCQISPANIPTLLKQQLETGTLMPVLNCLKISDSPDTVVEYLTQFAKVARFDMAILFMSDDEKKDVRSLFNYLTTRLPARSSELWDLSKKYGLQ